MMWVCEWGSVCVYECVCACVSARECRLMCGGWGTAFWSQFFPFTMGSRYQTQISKSATSAFTCWPMLLAPTDQPSSQPTFFSLKQNVFYLLLHNFIHGNNISRSYPQTPTYQVPLTCLTHLARSPVLFVFVNPSGADCCCLLWCQLVLLVCSCGDHRGCSELRRVMATSCPELILSFKSLFKKH